MKPAKWLGLPAVLALAIVLAPVPAIALGPPKTLVAGRSLGTLAGSSGIVDSDFPVGYLGVSWVSGSEPSVSFLVAGRWTSWVAVQRDDAPVDGHARGGRTFSALVPAYGAEAYQVRGRNSGVQAEAINTTDGPRTVSVGQSQVAEASLSEPSVISRSQWGADESYRFRSDGTEIWPPAFYATKMLIVHHTATQNNDPDPAATVRAIYYYHAVTEGWGDIGYNFLIDAQGNIYKGRYSGPSGTWYQDTPTGENPNGLGVTGAHTSGWNSGTVGIAVLGTYTSVQVPAASRSALVNMLAWEADRNGIDPQATSLFTNPVSGAQKTNPTISGHRDWVATECPGDSFYGELPSIRSDVAAAMPPSPSQTASYPAGSVALAKGTSSSSVANLSADDGVYYQVASVKRGRKSNAVDWYGEAQIGVSGVQKLTLTFDSSYTRSVSQTLYVFSFSTNAWQQIASASVSTTDQTFTWSTSNPAPYLSATGQSRMRAVGTSGGAFTAQADFMQFTVQY